MGRIQDGKRDLGGQPMKRVMLWIGAGQIGIAITRRMGYGMKIIVADKTSHQATAAAKIMNDAGFDAEPVVAKLSSRQSIWNDRSRRYLLPVFS